MQTPRKASESPFPYGRARRVCYIEHHPDDGIRFCHYVAEIKDAAARAVAGESTLYAAWPGEYKTDLFVIDDPQRLVDAL